MLEPAFRFLPIRLTRVIRGLFPVAMLAMLAPLSVGAQTAMRAPLNIVPPLMQEAIGQPQAKRTSDKLAPRVAARQSKRAVRAVAAAPGSESSIVQVGQLGALQDAPIGLETGYGSELWRGARLAFIADQMARLPKDVPLAALREAELKLYRSTTAAPVGTVDGSSWYAARLTRFLALGDTASVLQLEQLTGAVTSDPYAARAVVLAHLGRGAGEAACAIAAPKRGTRGYADTLGFFMQLLVFCQLRAGEFEKAGLTLQLNEKSLGEDRFYRDLAFLMSAQAQPVFGTQEDVAAAKEQEKEPPLVVPSVLTPMQLALLQLAGYGLSIDLRQLPPYFMQALAEDYAQPAVTQLGAALAAMRHGTVSAERFSQLSQLADLSAYQAPPMVANGVADDGVLEAAAIEDETTDEIAGAPAPSDAVFLALALLKVDAQSPTVEDGAGQAAMLRTVLAEAEARGLWRDMVLLLDDRLLNLTLAETAPAPFPADAPVSELTLATATASSTAPSLVDSNNSAALLPALHLLRAEGQIDALALMPSYMTARLLGFGDEVQPLENLIAALPDAFPDAPLDGFANNPFDNEFENNVDPDFSADFDNQSGFDDLPMAEGDMLDALADMRPHPIADWQIFEADYATASYALKTYLARELAVYQGLGFELPEAYRIAVNADAPSVDAQRMQKLAENKWIGDLLLALVDMYGAKRDATLENSDIVTLLAALRQAGLYEEADALAAELMVQAAGRLSLADPSALWVAPPVDAQLVLP